ncbi:MAG TPA: hypothetical protein VE170_16585 [Candidatus Limnocylindria bacterium]|nr:hypothetical protein [Candidatus Limnocylindria bacterium]
MKLEKAGVATATIVSSEFWTLAQAESRARGMADLPLVEVPHPVGTISLEALRSMAESVADAIAGKLITGNGASARGLTVPSHASAGSAAASLSVPSDPGAMFSHFFDRGWTDGLPVLPPTVTAVQAMIAAGGKSAATVLGVIPPLNGVATVEKIAANAVMAGCLPEYFPLVLAALRGMTQPGYNLDGLQTTTGNIAPLAIVNGPCRNALAINYGANVLGQGWRANATIGRAIRFVLTNVGGARPGSFDKSTMGQPAKYTFCFGENEEESPWQPFHVERGLARNCDALHMFGASGIYSAVDMASQSATGLLKTFALTMTGGLASGVTSTEVLWVICPEHASILARDGYSKAKLREALFLHARVPYDKIADENLELLAKRRPLWFKPGGLREVGVVDRPDDIWLVVAGGAGAKSAYIPGRTATRMQTVAVRERGAE